MVKEQISCFLTGGYSEAGYMQQFLMKINPSYDYMQKLPNKTVKRKGMPRTIRSDFSGLTGDGLIDKICELLAHDSVRKDVLNSKAILIEDDTDDRFAALSMEQLSEKEDEIRRRICGMLKRDMPVLFLYACPEIEGWFCADWEHGFGSLYTNDSRMMHMSPSARQYFNIRIRQKIAHDILQDHENPEEYASFTPYLKFSDRIKDEIQKFAISPSIDNPRISKQIEQEIHDSRCLYYSKQTDGAQILKKLEPDRIAAVCKVYYLRGYEQLRRLG